MPGYLIFVDTNVLLDFYRVRRESGLRLLEEIDNLHGHLITTYQVEMEFKKNRQLAILESLRGLKNREPVPHPAFLAESKSAAILNKRLTDANARIKRFRERLQKVLVNPTTHDPVYKVVQRMFVDATPTNLTRDKKERNVIKRLAFRRFILGYPPRKSTDTYMGDALNWEWIVHVARETGEHVAIVSRDGDYGVEVDDVSYVNDWLLQEFRDRVTKKRQLLLYSRLAPALKLLEVKVTKEAEEEEKQVSVRREEVVSPAPWPEVGPRGWQKRFTELIRDIELEKLVVTPAETDQDEE